MEYIVENQSEQTFLKVNGKLAPGIAFIKVFESKSDAKEYLEKNFPQDEALSVVEFVEGFT